MSENVKMIKVSTPISYPSGTFAIASTNHLTNSPQILQITANSSNVNNVNLVDLGKKLLDACRNGETEEVRSLMQSGAPFTTDWLGTSPLHFAAQYGHAETAELLLRAGVSRDTRTKVDRTPLHAAAQEGHLSIVNLLIVHGADVDAKDLLKMTPLHWAVERGHTDVVECLLTNSADVNAMSKFDKTPIDIALDTGRLDLVPLLQKYIHIQRPKPEMKPQINVNSKVKNTILPNKANRTTKITKQPQTIHIQQAAPQTTTTTSSITTNNPSHSKPLIINSNAKVNFDALRKLISNSNNGNANNNNNSNDSTNQVYATLAALAEVSSAADALKLLESYGITANTSSNNESTFIQSAYEGGQTVSLTEAGKLALDWIKDQGNQNCGSSNSSSGNKNSGSNKVITIVADSTQLPQIINSTQATPIVVVSDNESQKINKHIRITRPITTTLSSTNQQSKITTLTVNSKPTSITTTPVTVIEGKDNHHSSSNDQVLKLQKELEMIKKQAEEYKNQLKAKEKEAQLYKQQLDAIKGDTTTTTTLSLDLIESHDDDDDDEEK